MAHCCLPAPTWVTGSRAALRRRGPNRLTAAGARITWPGQLARARADYDEALRALPGHVNARNGLAVLAAEQGDLDAAIGHWQALTANGTGVDSAFLLSNLGYAYYLRGDLALALATLENACLQDPLNYRAWHHLGNVLGNLGQTARAAAMHRQAMALRGHDFKSDYAVAPGASLPAIENAVRAVSSDDALGQDRNPPARQRHVRAGTDRSAHARRRAAGN
ncbi:tetratricopeptide repeat protein [Massilia sp. H-1]|nr:tetratricopeptide repeat protein [Massilia sp. H-1]